MLTKDKYNGIELNKWYRHRGSITVPKRVQEMRKLDSSKKITMEVRLRSGKVLKVISILTWHFQHSGGSWDIMVYRFINKKKTRR